MSLASLSSFELCNIIAYLAHSEVSFCVVRLSVIMQSVVMQNAVAPVYDTAPLIIDHVECPIPFATAASLVLFCLPCE